jgi:hypothetical protein
MNVELTKHEVALIRALVAASDPARMYAVALVEKLTKALQKTESDPGPTP